MGNLTRAPETRSTPSGATVCNFSVAVNRRYKDSAGNDVDEATYVDFEAFNKTAEIIAKYTSKGSCILVDGRLKLDQWSDKATGEKRSRLKVIVEGFQFIGQKQNADKSDDQQPIASPDGKTKVDEVPF